MQRAANRWRQSLLLGAMALLAGCAEQVAEPTAPIAGAAASRAAYAFSTAYGQMWNVDGEQMPAGYGWPWSAVVSDRKSSVDFPMSCGRACDVRFIAYMNGLWHNTRQTIHWQVNNLSGSSPKQTFGWSCAWRVGPLNCALAEITDTHEVHIETCDWRATVSSDHAAWWGAWFDTEVGQKKTGEIGWVETSSVGTPLSANFCVSSPAGSGGGGGSTYCFDFYLAWTDRWGYHEVYLRTECYDGGAAT